MSRPTTQKGFTLTELIMVIVILGVLSAVALPMWFSKSDFEARGYFDEVIQAARYAQKIAVVSNCPVAFTVTGDGFSLAILAHADFPHCVNTPVSLPGKSPPYSKPSGITSGIANVTFQPSGSSSTGATIVVGGNSMQIHAATGFVERLP